MCRRDSNVSSSLEEGGRERCAVRPAHIPSLSARAVQQREQERAAWKKERGIRLRERREQRDEEFRLHEQQGLSPPVMSEYSSEEEEEEEESDGGHDPPERWEPAPLTESRRGGRGTRSWGGRGGARRRAVYGRGGARRGVADTRRGGVWRRDGEDHVWFEDRWMVSSLCDE
jgi:hypothetical protein